MRGEFAPEDLAARRSQLGFVLNSIGEEGTKAEGDRRYTLGN